MFLSDTAIRRPIFTIMAMSALVLFGYLGYRDSASTSSRTSTSPTVSVTTSCRERAPEVVESAVTDVIENELSSSRASSTSPRPRLSGVPDLGRVRARPRRRPRRPGRARQGRGRRRPLPNDVEPPVVSKLDISAQPNLWIALMGPDARAIGEYARWTLRPRLQTVEGVGNIFLGGFQEREIRVWVDREGSRGTGSRRARSSPPSSPRTSRCRAARSSPARARPWSRSRAKCERGRVRGPRRGMRKALRSGSGTSGGSRTASSRSAASPAGAERSRSASASRPARGPTRRLRGVAGACASDWSSSRPSFPEGMTAEIAYDGAEYIERSIADAQPGSALRRVLRDGRRAPLPPLLALDADHRPRDPDLAPRHVRVHELLRLHDQHDDRAGAGALGRRGDRRRDRRAREHLPPHGGGEAARGSRGFRDPGDRARGRRDDVLAWLPSSCRWRSWKASWAASCSSSASRWRSRSSCRFSSR